MLLFTTWHSTGSRWSPLLWNVLEFDYLQGYKLEQLSSSLDTFKSSAAIVVIREVSSSSHSANMGLLRSEPMTPVVPVEGAREFIDWTRRHRRAPSLTQKNKTEGQPGFIEENGSGSGKHTKMQFEDLNARDMHRPYKKLGEHDVELCHL